MRIVRKTIRIEDVRRDVERLLREESMTYSEWQRLGQVDKPGYRLTSERLRDAYLLCGPLLRRDDETKPGRKGAERE